MCQANELPHTLEYPTLLGGGYCYTAPCDSLSGTYKPPWWRIPKSYISHTCSRAHDMTHVCMFYFYFAGLVLASMVVQRWPRAHAVCSHTVGQRLAHTRICAHVCIRTHVYAYTHTYAYDTYAYDTYAYVCIQVQLRSPRLVFHSCVGEVFVGGTLVLWLGYFAVVCFHDGFFDTPHPVPIEHLTPASVQFKHLGASCASFACTSATPPPTQH